MKEKDYIEELILNNLENLNENEPNEGHFDRFEEKLKRQHKKKRITTSFIFKVAAAVIFVLLASNQIAIYLSQGTHVSILSAFNKEEETTLSTISPEYREVEFYYTNSINVSLNQWEELKNEGLVSNEEQEMMTSELNEFETRFKNLQKDLSANPNDDRVINAMLEFYQAKLSVINIIVNKLEEVKQQTNKNHEIEI